MRTPKATAWDPADLKQTEGYVRFSIHWGFIFGPLLSLLLLTAGPMSLASPIPWLYLAVLTTALWGALAVLHTRLRDADLLSASRWDASSGSATRARPGSRGSPAASRRPSSAPGRRRASARWPASWSA